MPLHGLCLWLSIHERNKPRTNTARSVLTGLHCTNFSGMTLACLHPVLAICYQAASASAVSLGPSTATNRKHTRSMSMRSQSLSSGGEIPEAFYDIKDQFYLLFYHLLVAPTPLFVFHWLMLGVRHQAVLETWSLLTAHPWEATVLEARNFPVVRKDTCL